MSLAASRVVLRRSTFAVRRAGIRNASSTSEAASAAKEKAGEVQSKASEGLSRVTSSAGSALSKAGSAAAGTLNALGKVGGRTGRLVGGIQSLIPPTIYYSKVALEVGKLVAKNRNMSLPSSEAFQSSFQPLLNGLRNPSTLTRQPISFLNQARSLSSAQWVSAGVVVAEVIGFFSVGEMLGRFKVVGYRSSAPAHH